MTFAQMRELVSNYVCRAEGMFQDNTTNVLGNAINSAIKHAQRLHSFELCRDVVTIPFSPTGGPVTNLVSVTDPLAVRDIKEIEQAYIEGPGSPAEIIIADAEYSAQNRVRTVPREGRPRLYRRGDRVILAPAATVDVTAHIVYWLPDLVDDSDTNFFLTDLHDWTLLRAVMQLNFFLREDDRFQISTAFMRELWLSALTWDSSLTGNSTMPLNLD